MTGAQGFASLVIFIPGAGFSHVVFDLKLNFEQGHREAALSSEGVAPYLRFMSTAFAFCLPTAAKVVPAGPDWIHEIKYDGYRLRVERNGNTVRLFTRNGHDWTKRFPWIVEAALKNREQQFVIDGEAVVLGVDGVSDFNALHSRRHDDEVQLYAFDVLALGSARTAIAGYSSGCR
ncbi:putative DNA ligase [Bradyrhizobium cosmicum]|uniref:DNA ligase n=1 Tax=Bradyrhizobium cosmicum TaxID=1404864 RepID=A0AAI8MD49_9BRAD|nr:putative DNA ligase [Bradyrhizobium cosmicum]BAL76020.1 putative DNA ligase [Bradyrhizobium cosmicum]